jgi:hypothetical protein
MKLALDKKPGRPKTLPDMTPIIKQAIAEWNDEQEKDKLTWTQVLDDIILFTIRGEIALLLLVVILYISSRIHL